MSAETPYLRSLLQAAFRAALLAAALFLPSRDAGWLAGWLYAGGFAAWSILNVLLLGRSQPGLLRLRETEAPAAVEAWDKFFVYASAALLALLLLVCGGEGPAARFTAVSAGAFGVIFAALGLFTWALLCNPHASGVAVVRPGQATVDAGPYRALRHPVYFASIIIAGCTPAALGAASAYVPALLLALLVAVRAGLEDRLLLRSLPGYKEYAARVPHRLLPGIW